MNEEQAKKLKERTNKVFTAYKTFFSTEEGEIVLADLMKSCGYLSSIIGRTPEETYYNEGKRNVVLQIMQTAQLKPADINRITKSIQEQEQYF